MNYVFQQYVPHVSKKDLTDTIRNSYPISFILMITKNKTSTEYHTLKEKTIVDMGIPSQCITERNIAISEKKSSILKNITIEMNAKLGGIPWMTSIPMKPHTMIVGMDVNHSGEVYHRSKSSLVGFVSSYDSKVCAYYSQIQVQKPGVELVENIKNLMRNAIENFMNENKTSPTHIIFYRDGVGSGQEDHIYNQEILAIQQVCKEYNSIPLNFILVLKRINNRIYAGLNGNNFGNLKPGTVLDGDILTSDPNEMSFFLQSHHVDSFQGTATPTRYKVLENGSGFNKVFYQNISYQLCHLYYNRLGISSVPVPCILAHKVAFLHGQSNISKSPHKNLNKKQYYL
ncbi:predicted protein [Naegleria gruberi]|uniref:Predicted protein n=1 Tax=Naegleria gruberi TaxID=5762 RepID=D2V2M6_NAEGR|nr:uncharacterized protein NAEGRDRAFT_63051 [Naegleria gruberi]EFC49085.1 predicted protein [Naegleria gruberi]|eukprot:XP_002681829.1 predicted protein [Naegleria gruberi strain NEG-M]